MSPWGGNRYLAATFKYLGALTEGACELCFGRLRHCCPSSLPCCSATDYCTCCMVNRSELAALIQSPAVVFIASYGESELNHWPAACSGWGLPVCQLSHRTQEENLTLQWLTEKLTYLVKDLRHSLFGFEVNSEILFSVWFPKDVINNLITEMILLYVNDIF